MKKKLARFFLTLLKRGWPLVVIVVMLMIGEDSAAGAGIVLFFANWAATSDLEWDPTPWAHAPKISWWWDRRWWYR